MNPTFSLWLMPEGELYKKFFTLISDLMKEYNGVYFEPHVTLIGAIQIDKPETCKLIASRIKPYTITFETIDYTDYKYRALFLRVVKTPEVMEAYQQAREILKYDNADYMPHMSLYYGSLPIETKEAIIKKIGRTFTDEFVVNKIHLYSTPLDKESEWRKIKSFPLR